MNPKRKIQGRKTSKKANRKMNLKWERDLVNRVLGPRPTFSSQHPEDEATNEDLNELVELSETSDDETIRMPESGEACEKETNGEPKEVVPDHSDITETSERELKVKEDQYECKDCKLKSENKNNLRNHVCNTQKKLKSITDHKAHRQSNDNKENAKLKVDDEIWKMYTSGASPPMER